MKLDFEPDGLNADDWDALVDHERDVQIEKGYDHIHDFQSGTRHLLNEAINRGREGKFVQAFAIIESAHQTILNPPHNVLRPQPGEWESSDGAKLQMCVVEEFFPGNNQQSVQAIATVGGLSLCRAHLDATRDALREGQPMTQIMMQILAGEF